MKKAKLADRLTRSEVGQFGLDLLLARRMWREHRSLVERETFPESFAAPTKAEWGHDSTAEEQIGPDGADMAEIAAVIAEVKAEVDNRATASVG